MGKNEQFGDPGCCGCLAHLRGSRRLTLAIVAIAILLDNMLLTSVVPIIPSLLYHLRHENQQSTTATYTATHQGTSVTELPKDNEKAPFFLPRLKVPQKVQESEWDIPGLTLVPGDVFWSFTTPAPTTEESDYSDQDVVEDKDDKTVQKELRHQELVDENFEVGIMFASKPLVQALINPFVGPLSSRIGYSIIMFVGFIVLFTSTMVFAIGNSYGTLFMARALQGVGSSCTSVAGMGMLAETYPDDAERGNAMAIALGGLALGVLIGPVFGGTLYEFIGKSAPFLILAGLAVIDGLLQLLVLQPKVKKQENEDTPILSLLKDPYIVIAAGAITFANMGIAVLEPSLPLWMMDTMDATKWQQGAAFLPSSISYLIGTNLFGPVGHKIGRWLAAMIGLVVIGICLICVPMAKSVEQLIPANAGIGFAIGMVDSSMMPLLGYLVDIRHTSVYGCVYAIADVAFCIGFIIGPTFSASIVQRLGFDGTVYTVAFISFLYAPLMIMLRNPPGKAKNELLSGDAVKYTLYSDDDRNDAEVTMKLNEEQTCY